MFSSCSVKCSVKMTYKLIICKVRTDVFHAIVVHLHWDNPRALASGLSPRTGKQTMVYSQMICTAQLTSLPKHFSPGVSGIGLAASRASYHQSFERYRIMIIEKCWMNFFYHPYLKSGCLDNASFFFNLFAKFGSSLGPIYTID